LNLILLSFLFLSFSTGSSSDKTIDSSNLIINTVNIPLDSEYSEYKNYQACENNLLINWPEYKYLPKYINHNIRTLMLQRCLTFLILDYEVNEATIHAIFDRDIQPSNLKEFIFYIPRAIFLGFFSPYPNDWLYNFQNKFSVFYLIAPLSSLIFLLSLASLFLWIDKVRHNSIFLPIFITGSVIFLYGLSTPFIGALYRYRFPWYVMLTALGIASLISFLPFSKYKSTKDIQEKLYDHK
jgi:hypothetical protein